MEASRLVRDQLMPLGLDVAHQSLFRAEGSVDIFQLAGNNSVIVYMLLPMFAYLHPISRRTLSVLHFPFLVSLSCPQCRMAFLPVAHQSDVQKAISQKIKKEC